MNKSVMDGTDRVFILVILALMSIAFWLINGQIIGLKDRVEVLEQIEAVEKVCRSGQRISIDTNISHYSEPGSNYLNKSCIDIPTGDWTSTRGKSIGIRIGGMPYNVHISDPMRN